MNDILDDPSFKDVAKSFYWVECTQLDHLVLAINETIYESISADQKAIPIEQSSLDRVQKEYSGLRRK